MSRVVSALLSSVFFLSVFFCVPVICRAEALTPLAIFIDASTDIVTHDAGGHATNFSGTTSFPFGPVGSTVFFCEAPDLSEPTGGTTRVFAESIISNISRDMQNPLNPSETLSFPTALYVDQFINAASAFAQAPTSASASISAVIEFTVPDFGTGTGLVWDSLLEVQTEAHYNGGSVVASVNGIVENLTDGTVLASTNSAHFGPSQLIFPDPGDILRISFEGDLSASFVTGDYPIDAGWLQFYNVFGVVSVPEPSSIALAACGAALVTFGLILRHRA